MTGATRLDIYITRKVVLNVGDNINSVCMKLCLILSQ